MENMNYLNVRRIILIIITLHVPLAFSQINNLKIKLEKVPTTIEKPIGMFSIEDTTKLIRHIIRTEQELFFCDKDFSVIRTINVSFNTLILVSENHQYFILKKNISEYSNKFTLMDYTGKQYWSKKIFFNRNTQNVEFIPMDNGTVFQIDGDSLYVIVYSTDGEIIKKEVLLNDIKNSYAKRICYDVSDNGEYVVILTEKRRPMRAGMVMGRPPKVQDQEEMDRIIKNKQLSKRVDGEPTIFLYNNHGVLLAHSPVEQEKPISIYINKNGSLILYVVEDIDKKEHEYTLTLIDIYFNKKFSKITTSRLHAALFLEDLIIISYVDKRIEYIAALDIRSGEEIWMKKLDHRCPFLYEDSDNIYALLSKKRTYSSPEGNYWLFILDLFGNVISQTDLGLINQDNIWSVQHLGKNLKGKYIIKDHSLMSVIKY